ncbi:protein FAM200A-like [Centruroides vittatus]|uniref:protein FAM200A-like n=1 Tax=Centruroides vittatus TaxID=120091 RepID=UPI00350FA66F
MVENNLEWTKCVGVCTDGGRSMSGSYGGLQALIRNKAPDSVWTHCIIHREALASKAKTPSEFTSLEEESLIDLSCDNTLKLKFGSMELSDFWISVKEEYPLLSGKALRILIPFATSYLCEAGFSAVAVIKSKYRSKINVEQEMRVAISNFIPRFEKLCSEHQAHPSH